MPKYIILHKTDLQVCWKISIAYVGYLTETKKKR